MARLGRSQPVQPTVWHGPDGQGANVQFVPLDAQRQRNPVPPAVVVSGAQLVNSGVGVPGTAPPAPLSVDRVDQRNRLVRLDPIVVSGALASFPAAPTVNPPAPFLVPIDERRRFLASLPPNVTVGLDDVVPPKPNLVEPDRRRVLPTDPFTSSTAGAATAPAPATPPPPFIVPVDERGRFLVVLPATGQHGFVDPGPGPVGTTPPPAQSIDRVDRRLGSKPIDPLVLSGVLVPVAPASAFHDESPMLTLVGLMR